METPKSLGYRMPAEWEKHEATWAVFPHNENTWPGDDGKRFQRVQESYAEMIAHVSSGEKVQLLVQNDKIKNIVEKLIFHHPSAKKENIIFHKIPTMDSWMRDSGPTFVVNRKEKKLAMVHWIFNAWGMKYEEEGLFKDTIIPKKMNEILKIRSFEPGIVMEGGSIEVNGRDTVLVTEQCQLNKNRNPNLTKEQIEKFLRDYLNVEKVVWLGEGIEGDDTDGHIDDLVRFVNENTVLCCMPDREDEFNYPIMEENKKRLIKVGLKVVDLPMPGHLVIEGRRIPASYANFYISNAAVVVPIFNVPNDKKALDIIQKFFPDRKVVGIYATDTVFGFGTWHCLTQQQPTV